MNGVEGIDMQKINFVMANQNIYADGLGFGGEKG